jgi:hypothetical protein
LQNKEISKTLSKGCPQGSACGPGFWTIIIDTLLKINFPEGVEIQAFADDCLLMVSSKTTSELEVKVNQALNQIHLWSIDNKLEFNTFKTTTVLFTKNIKYNKPKFVFNNTVLEISKSMEYLGIIIDSKLDFKKHINNMKTKVMRFVMNITQFAKNKFGFNRHSLEVIYIGAVIPMISYGSPVWVQVIDRNDVRTILERIQRLIAMRMCSAYRTVSKNALNIITNLIPIDLKIKQLSIEYCVKKGVDSELFNEYFTSIIDLN